MFFMKKSNLFAIILLAVSFVFTFASCDNPDATTITPKFTISYITDYGTQPEDKEVSKGYHLTDADLPFLIADDYEFNGWLFDDEPVQAGYEVINNITLIASWTSTKCTITYSTDYGTAPETKKVTKGYKLTDDDLPALDDEDDYIKFQGWTINNEIITAGYVVTKDIKLIAKWSEFEIDPEITDDDEKGKSKYLTFKFDVSDVNKDYGLSIQTPSDIEVYAGENAVDGIAAVVNISKLENSLCIELPKIQDQTIDGKKYKVLWTYEDEESVWSDKEETNVIVKKQIILQETVAHSADSNNCITSNIGSIRTLKAILKKYGKVTIATKRGTAPEAFELYESQQIAFSDMPRPKSAFRKLEDYKLKDKSALVPVSIGEPYYIGTGENVTLEAEFGLSLGDIVLVDGTVVGTNEYNKEKDPDALAVIFYLGDGEEIIHSSDVLAVGIEKSLKVWNGLIAKDAEAYKYYREVTNNIAWPVDIDSYFSEQEIKEADLKKVNDWQSMGWFTRDNVSHYDYDGEDNYEKIKGIDPDGSYPALEYAYNYGKTHGATSEVLKNGWYLPTVNVYQALVGSLSRIDSALKKTESNFSYKEQIEFLNPVTSYRCWTSNTEWSNTSSNPIECFIQPESTNGGSITCAPSGYDNGSTEFNVFAVIKLPD